MWRLGAPWLILVAALTLGPAAAHAQPQFTPWADPLPSVHRQPNGSWAESPPSADSPPGPMTPASGTSFAGMSAAITIVYMDVVNAPRFGFDHPTLGSERRDTLEFVMTYLEAQLNAPGDLTIDVEESLNSNSSGILASASPYIQLGDGYQRGHAFRHLVEGIDVNPTVGDSTVNVNFGYNWNTGEAAPNGAQYDLYSVLLHEITHGLGIRSTADSNGDGPQSNVLTRTVFDSFLFRGATQ